MKSQLAFFSAATLAVLFACSSTRDGFQDEQPGDKDAGPQFEERDAAALDPLNGRDPVTCAEAKEARSYVGCDYWPTVTPNIVQGVFDYAVAVANVGEEEAEVTVTGPNGVDEKVTVAGGSLEKIYLPWVNALKGPADQPIDSLIAKKSAYHLVSSRPVVVYQFNPLEFKAEGGPPGKKWSACVKQSPTADACYSYSNDASLLLPSTAMTGTYRVMGPAGQSGHPRDFFGELDLSAPLNHFLGSYVVVTATADGTTVSVKLGENSKIVAGTGVSAAEGGGALSLELNAGDVALVATDLGNMYDPSGSLITANHPVQVITGVQCANAPMDIMACDHIEETVFPAETLGKHYVVTRPTGPFANDVGHVVRFFGNADDTTLTYKPSKPSGCPSKLAAGEVAECTSVVEDDFEVSGDHEFGVGTISLGGELTDPDFDRLTEQPQGDPSQSFAVTVEQYRKRYVFLAPADYKTNYVDVVGTGGTKLTLDGKDVSESFEELKGTDYSIARIKLGEGKDGAHVLEASNPVGIQVLGYGDNTTYQYPGGLNLGQIAAPPVK